MIVAGAAKCRFCGAIFDPRLKAQVKRAAGSEDDNPGAAEWVLCILCSGIGCIVGIVYAIQGKPKGLKMVAISIVAGMVWGAVNAFIQMSVAPHHFR